MSATGCAYPSSVTTEEACRVAAALSKLDQSGRELEAFRPVLVRRAAVALAAGADERSVADAAGVQLATLRRWLRSWQARPDGT